MEDVRPDRSFMRQMRLMDKRLGIKYNGEHFVITFQTQRYGEVNIWKVADERGGFRQPDQRELDMLGESSLERLGPEDRWNLSVAYMKKYREDAKEAASQAIHDMAKDGRIQVAQQFRKTFGVGKGNSAFRRIEHGSQS